MMPLFEDSTEGTESSEPETCKKRKHEHREYFRKYHPGKFKVEVIVDAIDLSRLQQADNDEIATDIFQLDSKLNGKLADEIIHAWKDDS